MSTATPTLDFIDDAALLLVGFADEEISAHLDRAKGLPPFRHASSLAEADDVLTAAPISVMVLGPGVTHDSIDELIDSLESFKTRHPFQNTVHITVGLEQREAIQRLVQADLLYFAAPRELDAEQLGDLAARAFGHFRRSQIFGMAAEAGIEDRRAVAARRLTSVSETLMQTVDLESLADPVFETLREMLGAEQAKLWLYDPVAHTLYDAGASAVEMSAATGMTALAARAGRPRRKKDSLPSIRSMSFRTHRVNSFHGRPFLRGSTSSLILDGRSIREVGSTTNPVRAREDCRSATRTSLRVQRGDV